MESVEKLAKRFGEFPGIGPRQARRFVYFLLWNAPEFAKGLAEEILALRKSVRLCPSCFRFFSNGKGAACSTCADPNRDDSSLLVVCRDSDRETVEKSAAYRGHYFVLGGSIPILEQNPEKRIRAKELLENVGKRAELREIIIAVNATPEGEHTAEFIASFLKDIAAERKIRITKLGRGLSTGLELEYSDPETLANALKNRG
jgi:recombination protein RecR